MEKLESFEVYREGQGSYGQDLYIIVCPKCKGCVTDTGKCRCGFEWSVEIKAVGRKLTEE